MLPGVCVSKIRIISTDCSSAPIEQIDFPCIVIKPNKTILFGVWEEMLFISAEYKWFVAIQYSSLEGDH